MPIRALLPTISITWIVMSSPSMMRSFARRVMMSTVLPPWKLRRIGRLDGALHRNRLGDACEQRRAHGSVLRLVDHLEATAGGDHDRRPQVGRAVLDRLSGADGDVDICRSRIRDADALGLRVGQLHLVIGEE